MDSGAKYYCHAQAVDGSIITRQQYLEGQLLKFANPANASLLFAVGAVLLLLDSDVAAVSQADLCEDTRTRLGAGARPT